MNESVQGSADPESEVEEDRGVAVELRIHGRVQGVWFRESARRQAESLDLRGRVRNDPDGTVTITAEGPQDKIDALVEWCHEGPPLAKVERVERNVVEPRGWGGFDVLR